MKSKNKIQIYDYYVTHHSLSCIKIIAVAISRETLSFFHIILCDVERIQMLTEQLSLRKSRGNILTTTDYSWVIIHCCFIYYFTLRQALTRRTKRTSLSHLPFSRVYEHFDGNGKCREFAEVPRHKARAAESKSNLWCSCCIENSFRLRRLTPNGGERQRGRRKGERKEERGISSWRVDIVISDLCST